MTNPELPPPSWRFADLNGGQEQYGNAAQEAFADDALTKAIRELLQNSLDAHDPHLGPVTIALRLKDFPTHALNSEQLIPHLDSCRAQFSKPYPDRAEEYAYALQMLRQPTIPVLACIDENTCGLNEDRWKRLILTEGAPASLGQIAAGGNHGQGKNAPFNLSRVKTVFYATRYVSRAIQGRVTRLTGKAQLASHPDPENPGNLLQPVGYYANHNLGLSQYNHPIEPPRIDSSFELTATGTGVYIIGFDLRHQDWKQQAVRAILQNYFAAILWRKLVVTIEDRNAAPIRIDHNNLSALLEGYCEPDDRTRHYCQALLQEKPATTNPRPVLGPPRRLDLYLKTAEQSQERLSRRLAHINRHGMLITEDSQNRDNPFRPTGLNHLIPWAAVTVAHDESTDQWIRAMEPAAHDAVHYRQIKDPDIKKESQQEIFHQRQEILRLIKERLENDANAAGEDITELKDFFPELASIKPGEGASLAAKIQKSRRRGSDTVIQTHVPEDAEGDEEDDENDGSWPNWTSKDKGPNTGNGKSNAKGKNARKGREGAPPKDPQPATIKNARILSPQPGEINLSFTMPQAKEVRLALQQAGEQRDKTEPSLPLNAITGGKTQLHSNGTEFILQALPGEKVSLRITLQKPPEVYCAYALVQNSQEEKSGDDHS